MKLEFKITVELAPDTVFAPATDARFLAGELCGFTAALMHFYAAGSEAPDIHVTVPEIPAPLKGQ